MIWGKTLHTDDEPFLKLWLQTSINNKAIDTQPRTPCKGAQHLVPDASTLLLHNFEPLEPQNSLSQETSSKSHTPVFPFTANLNSQRNGTFFFSILSQDNPYHQILLMSCLIQKCLLENVPQRAQT